MNLEKTGKFLAELRKSKELTQKEIADQIGVLPKTISKWETGHGFPDVSSVSKLAEILGVSTDSILSGELSKNVGDIGNMKRIKFYVCADCGNILTETGNGEMVCCGKKLDALKPQSPDKLHKIQIEEIEDDFYITWEHPMQKEHYIHFIAYVRFDRMLLVKLYPEQSGEIRFPKNMVAKYTITVIKMGCLNIYINSNLSNSSSLSDNSTFLYYILTFFFCYI